MLIGQVSSFGNEPVAPGRFVFVEPHFGDVFARGLRGEMPRVSELFGESHQVPPSFGERYLSQALASIGKDVEGDQLGRCCLREHVHPRLGGMDALLQRVEICDPVDYNHDLSINDGPRW